MTMQSAHMMERIQTRQYIHLDPPVQVDLPAPRMNLEQIIHNLASMYLVTIKPDSSHPEYFSFSTGGKNGHLTIKKEDPRTILYRGVGSYPWHVAFAKKIIHSNSGCHQWTIRTNCNEDFIKVGIYFGKNAYQTQADFRHGRFEQSSETYFAADEGAHMAGIHYGNGVTFGGETSKKMKKIARGDLIMKLNTSTASLSFSKDEEKCTFRAF